MSSYSFLDKKFFKSQVPEIYNDKLYKKEPELKLEPKARINASNHYETLENTATIQPGPTSPQSDYAQMLLHLDYVMNNELCREIIMKKFGLSTENSNLLSQELVELFSFILFGFLIVFILDRMRH
jgi:hypothetical protein